MAERAWEIASKSGTHGPPCSLSAIGSSSSPQRIAFREHLGAGLVLKCATPFDYEWTTQAMPTFRSFCAKSPAALASNKQAADPSAKPRDPGDGDPQLRSDREAHLYGGRSAVRSDRGAFPDATRPKSNAH